MNEHYYDPVEIWSYEEREGAYKRIAELEAELTSCHELQDSYCDRIAELEADKKHAEQMVEWLIDQGNFFVDYVTDNCGDIQSNEIEAMSEWHTEVTEWRSREVRE